MKNLLFTILVLLQAYPVYAQDSAATLKDRTAAETGNDTWMWIVGVIALVILVVIITRTRNGSANNATSTDRLKRPKNKPED